MREGLNLLGEFEDIVQKGVVQAQGAGVALLYSETSDVYLGMIGARSASFAPGLRTLYLALRHAELPVDIVIEPDAAAGLLEHYAALYVALPYMTTECGSAIASWVGKSGGSVFATAAGGLLNETNQTNVPFSRLLGVQQHGLWSGEGDAWNSTVFFVKQDLNFVQPLDTVTVGSDKLVVKGLKSMFAVTDSAATIVGKFKDGSAAVVERVEGRGRTTYAGFLPGLSYYEGAIPTRPVDRSSVDSGMNHFIPTAMVRAARRFIAAPLDGVAGARPVTLVAGETVIVMTPPCLSLLKNLMKVQGVPPPVYPCRSI